MKIAYLLPHSEYEFFHELTPVLQQYFDVSVNRIYADTDLILGGILPCSEEWMDHIDRSGKPMVIWHWDHYSFVNFEQPRWVRFNEYLHNVRGKTLDIWSCTYEVARQLKEEHELDSYVIPSWVNKANWAHLVKPSENSYVFYASSSAAFGKRVDWARKACELLKLPLTLIEGRGLKRSEYFEKLHNCRVYLMTAFEESNATIPAQEAGAMGKPVVLADLPASREIFGDTGYYFPPNNFKELLEQLETAWRIGSDSECQDRILRNYDLSVIGPKIIERLRYVIESKLS